MTLSRIHVGTSAGIHVLGGREKVHFEGREVNALARSDGAWWAIVEGREIWARSSGRGWTRRARVSSLRALCVQPDPRGAWVGTSEAHLTRIHRGEARRVNAFDAMPGRNAWFTPWGGPPDTRSISRGPEGALYVNVHVGGVARSLDGGERWEPTLDIDTDVHQVLAHPTKKRIVLAASAVGLGISRDHGMTWSFVTSGFLALYQRAVALAGSVVLVSSSNSERGERAAVYRRGLDDNGPFEKCHAGLPQWFDHNVNTHCIATEGRAAAIGTADGRVFASGDAGRTWKVLREGLPKVKCLAFEPVQRNAE